MPRYSVGKVNTAELEAAVHVAPAARSGGSGSNERRLSNASSSSISVGAKSGASQSDESTSGTLVVRQNYCITGVRRSRDGGTLGALRLEGVACFSLVN